MREVNFRAGFKSRNSTLFSIKLWGDEIDNGAPEGDEGIGREADDEVQGIVKPNHLAETPFGPREVDGFTEDSG